MYISIKSSTIAGQVLNVEVGFPLLGILAYLQASYPQANSKCFPVGRTGEASWGMRFESEMVQNDGHHFHEM